MSKLLKGWSTFEYVLLIGVIVLLCGVVGLAVFVVGEFAFWEERQVEERQAEVQEPVQAQAGVTPPMIETLAPLSGSEQGQAAGAQVDESPRLTLSPTSGAPGATVTIQGEGWPAGSRVILSLVPSEPPQYAVNSALVNDSGRFSAELIVPSDTRWLEESPVPVLAATDDGLSAQTSLTIIAPPDSQPVATPAAPAKVIVVAAAFAPDQPPPPETVPQLTTTANLNVRAGPGTNYPILGVLTLGQQAEIIGRNENATWWQIKFPGAKSGYGWVSAEYAQAANIGNVPVVKAPPAPAQPTPAPTPTPQPGLVITDWRGEYYNNRDLQGPPTLVRNDVAISFDWGLGSPDPRLPTDNFSVRWSRTANFSAGTYRFYARVDDGVRLWIDNSLLIDEWQEQSPTTYAADIYLTEGNHNLMLEYNELTGGATAILSWDRVDTYPDWKAEYYSNPNLQGAPVLVRNEGSINYNWGSGSPAPSIPADNFSVRWTRVSYFDGGDYLFRITSDDGHRVYFDNNLVLDNWRDGRTPVQEARRSVPAGLHELRVEYYERGGEALIGFSWQRADRQALGPQAIIRASSDGLVGQPVKFDGRRSRPGDSAIDKYDWDFGDGSTARGDQVSHTYRSPGDYRVRLTATDKNGVRDRTEVRVKIEQDLQNTTAPLAVLDGPSTGKTGDPVNFSGRRSQSLSPIVDYQWNFGDGTTGRGQDISHGFSQPGSYSVILTVVADNGLRSSDNLIVRVDDPLLPSAAPVARITAPSQGQTNQPVTFDATQSTSSHPLVSWQWNFGDGANANGPTVPHSFSAPGSYNVTLTVTDDQGQANSANQVITIADPPPSNQPPVPAISGPSQSTTSQAVTFDGSGSQSTNPITNYNWDFGDGNTATGPQVNHTYSQVGDFTVSLSVTDDQGQQDSTSQTIKVDPKPQPDPLTAKISGPTQGQAGQALSFDGQSSTSAAPLNSIQWDFGDGTTDSGKLTVSHTYQNPGNYTVLLTLANDVGQNNTTSQQVTIQDVPAANQPPQPAIQADATTVEAGETVNFDASGTSAGSPIASYDWDFGDGTAAGSGQLVSHDFTQPGSYDVTLTVTDQNGQSGTATQNVTVNAKAQPDPLTANINGPTSASVGQPVTFDGQQSTSAGPLTSVQWDFGDGTTGGGSSLSDLVIDHTYQQPGSYTVQLTLVNDLNQTNTASFDITVQPAAPVADQPQVQPPTAEIEGPSQAAVGEPVVFDGGYSQASSPIVQYRWGFGDGVTADGMGATHAFAAPGSYNVTLNVTDENGLSSSASHIIEIVANATNQPPAEQPTPEPTPEPGQPEVQPTEEPAPEAQPTEPPAPQEPVEQPAPQQPAQPPTAVIDGPLQVQAGVPVSFSGVDSQPGSSAIAGYQWGFGDGSADDQAEVTHTFPAAGQYQVTLTVIDENGLSDTAQLLVSAGPSQDELEAQAAAEAQRQAEEEAQRQAQEEAQRQAEQQAQEQAAAEATAQAEEAQRQAEEEAQRQAEEAQRQAEEEAQRQAEEAQRQAEEEAQRQAEEEAQRQAEEEAQRQAEEEARRQAEEAQQQEQEQQQDASQDDASDEGNQNE
jgi:PKD repeat protein